MKIRTGFVSNSSSSSYIIAITRNFKLPEHSKEELIAEFEDYFYTYFPDDEQTLSADEIVTIALDNLCSQKTIWQENAPAPVNALIGIITRDKELRKKHVIQTIDSGPDDGSYTNVLCDGEKEEFIERIKSILEM